MNLNETCLLHFLTNPDEIQDLCDIFIKNIAELDENNTSKLLSM